MLADKYGHFNVMILVVTFSVLIVLGLWLPGRSAAASIVFAVVSGIGLGAVVLNIRRRVLSRICTYA